MGVRRFDPAPILHRWCGRHGQPHTFIWRRRTRVVAAIDHHWTIKTAWWRGTDEAVDRFYYDLTTRDGLRCVVFRDGVADAWYMESIDD